MNSFSLRLLRYLAVHRSCIPEARYHAVLCTQSSTRAAPRLKNNGLPALRQLHIQRRSDLPKHASARALSGATPTEISSVRLAGVNVLPSEKMVEVSWASSGRSVYPWLWLRDNCQCSDCFHPVSLSRTFYLKDLDLNIAPVQAGGGDDDCELIIKWSDGHTSQHKASWLHARAFEDSQRENRKLIHKLPRKSWPAQLPSADWVAVMQSDDALLEWLLQLETYGFVLMHGATLQRSCVRQLADRVAFAKRTHYGEDFSVIVKPDPSNVAYSSNTLALHLDLPYYFYKPGVQFIHCVRQHEGSGGESQISDALEVARFLRAERPRQFEVLSSVPVDWVDHATEDGRKYFKTLTMPVICLEADGETVWRINYSQPQRDSHFSGCAVEEVNEWYSAIKTFHDLLNDPKFCRTFKMKPGEVMTLDNLRVAHGRTGYPESSEVRRHIEGCYVDWDEVRSRRRVLVNQIQSDGYLDKSIC